MATRAGIELVGDDDGAQAASYNNHDHRQSGTELVDLVVEGASFADEDPEEGSSILRDRTLTFTLVGDPLFLWIQMGGTSEIVHDGTSFTAPYVAGSSVVGGSPDRAVTLVRAGLWTAGALVIHAATDSTITYTVRPYALGDDRWLVAVGDGFDFVATSGTTRDPDLARDWLSQAAAAARAQQVGGAVRRHPVT